VVVFWRILVGGESKVRRRGRQKWDFHVYLWAFRRSRIRSCELRYSQIMGGFGRILPVLGARGLVLPSFFLFLRHPVGKWLLHRLNSSYIGLPVPRIRWEVRQIVALRGRHWALELRALWGRQAPPQSKISTTQPTRPPTSSSPSSPSTSNTSSPPPPSPSPQTSTP